MRPLPLVNADIPSCEFIFVPETDTAVNPLGIKGIGGLGGVGTNAAVCNAIYHSTGTRIRELPVRIEKLLGRREQDRNARASGTRSLHQIVIVEALSGGRPLASTCRVLWRHSKSDGRGHALLFSPARAASDRCGEYTFSNAAWLYTETGLSTAA